MARRMKEAAFREEQWRRRYDDHIASINRLVDDLNTDPVREGAPYVAPLYGGVNARLLTVLRDPGPKTQSSQGGSGFICLENDDPTAEFMCRLIDDSHISCQDVVPWNAHPWYINSAPKAAQLEAGIEPLLSLIRLLPNLRVVMLHGGSAHDCWRRLNRRVPNLDSSLNLHVIRTYHTSRQAFWHRDAAVREMRSNKLREAFLEAANVLAARP
jgi:hypothetical protein